MSISRKADALIASEPDAFYVITSPTGSYEKGIAKGHKRQISHTISPEVLRRVDETAAYSGRGRAAIINLSSYRFLESDSLTS